MFGRESRKDFFLQVPQICFSWLKWRLLLEFFCGGHPWGRFEGWISTQHTVTNFLERGFLPDLMKPIRRKMYNKIFFYKWMKRGAQKACTNFLSIDTTIGEIVLTD